LLSLRLSIPRLWGFE